LVDAAAVYVESGLAHGLAEGGVGVTGPCDVLCASAELHRKDGLGDQVGGPRPQDVDAEQAVGPRIGDDLDEAVALLGGPRSAVGHEREPADPDRATVLMALLLRLPDAGQLRPGVDDARHR